jgi:hypothetical protein
MKRTLMLTVAMVFAGHMAFAAISPDTIATDLAAQGYTRIEIKQGLTQIKVEAIRGTEKLEVIYDIETGAVLKSETGEVYQGENTSAGVEISTEDHDFVDGDDNDDDHEGDDDHDGDDDDDEGDDDEGDDDGDDDESDDDGDDNDDDGDDSDDDGDDGDDDDSDDDNSGGSGSSDGDCN